jgi:HSP20 family protein
MAQDLKRLIELLVAPPAGARENAWCPPADVYRTASGWAVKFDLAGVRPDELEVVVNGRTLVLRGMRRDWSIEEARASYQMEISYNRFERTIEMPCELERATLSIEYRDGMLFVRLSGCDGP